MRQKILITGGAGFIGCNAANKYIQDGEEVVVFDNLSRKGARPNLEWLKNQGSFEFIKGDVRNFEELRKVFSDHPNVDAVIHLAAQVAVTTSIVNPREDFEVNALGTFNVLEAIRESGADPILINASTNKVYGAMKNVNIVQKDDRYAYEDLPKGISEDSPLAFHSPYGCSKGTADQYVEDYARLYGLRTVNFRQSCIYGPRQFGVEDQGWVAYFTIAAVLDLPITIYGDGRQVRDILYVSDLMDVFDKCISCDLGHRVFNIGGGAENTISLLELLDLLEELTGKRSKLTFCDWRSSDQKVYISNISKAQRKLKWTPKISPREGVKKMVEWVEKNNKLFKGLNYNGPQELDNMLRYRYGRR